MRVCFLNNDLSERTGAGQFGLRLTGNLVAADRTLSVTVLTAVGCGHPRERAILPTRWWQLPRRWFAIREEFRRADIIHALDGWPWGVIAALAAIGLRKPLVITAIGTGAIQPLYGLRRWILAWAYRRADALAAISSYTRREILKKIPGLTIAVVNHAVDAAEFAAPTLERLPAEEQERIRSLRPYVLSVGAPKARKGFPDSLRAFALIAPKFPGLRYVIVGGGAAIFGRIAAELGIGDRVTILRRLPRPTVVTLYQNAELFLLMPRDVGKDVEGFGFAFLEAAAAGIPVIGTRESGAEDAVLDRENGALVAPGDAAAAADAMARILGDSALRARFRSASRSFARRMSWARVVASYRAMYHALTPEP